MKINTATADVFDHFAMGWQTISTAPFDRDLELAVLDDEGTHALAFPCRRVLRGWIKSLTNEPVYVYPTHWRDWRDQVSPLLSHSSS
ncbi:hypothetical protein HAP47_0001445 [Bradyrhizobium sp. 41S5]|uniref:hypothetical protein n=1 Tax=Bradyrhizobium sp. 41S5 TaxID=1404443 RepID=UPI001E3FB2FF|nr:hypothetical protein [Bradyrhizobium sp. 41S5]UFX45424.1 hypothetical protein HAP47_0001445 [Bradyrhizobium sp. 41S5]